MTRDPGSVVEDTHRMAITGPADVTLAERNARAVVAEIEFSDAAIDEIAIVVRELASNIVKHAGNGTLSVERCTVDGRRRIEIRAVDSGPGIADVDVAREDGYSTAGGLGCGLGAVHRLMDDVIIEANENGTTGVHIIATRWAEASTPPSSHPPITAGAATRAKPGMQHNGDSFIIKREHRTLLVGVIDGLGHGRPAHRASQHARQHVRDNASQPLSRLFRGVERACRNTRGVVMALARFDFETGTVQIGSVGNIEVVVLNSPDPMNIVTPRGVLGARGPEPAIREWEWDSDFVLVMHSDGISTQWSREDVHAQIAGMSATVAARKLLYSLAESRDDATVLVVSEAHP